MFPKEEELDDNDAPSRDVLAVYLMAAEHLNAIQNKTVENCKNSLVIIDEAHNLRTLDGSRYENIYG